MPRHPNLSYPYERLTEEHTADIARRQDRRINHLVHENQLLKNELYELNTWRKKVTLILEANNIDIDTMWNTMLATADIFKEPKGKQ